MSFLTPLYLIGAGLVVLPIVLHLLRRDVAPPVPFTAVHLLRRTSVERACPSMPSTRDTRAATWPMSRLASRVICSKVSVFRNFPTHNPPVYRAARLVGRMWFGPADLSP